MRKIVFAWVALLALSAAAGFAQSGTMMAPPARSGGDSMMSGGAGSMMSDDKSRGDDQMMSDKGRMLRTAMSTGHKVIFTDLAAARRLAEKGPTVLFFAADWCPDCRADLEDINANGSRLGDVTVVVADYDKTADIKAMYGITSQHSYVQIDSHGKALAIWNGGGVEGILAHVDRM